MDLVKLSYWLGVMQTDGYYKIVPLKGKNSLRKQICLDVSAKNLSMLEKFAKYSKECFGIKGTRYFNSQRNTYYFAFGCAKLESVFSFYGLDFSDPPKPSLWLFTRKELFGAYLAGVIDGDGDVRIKRPKYPQCAVRITSGSFQKELQDGLKQFLGIKSSVTIQKNKARVSDGREIRGSGYRLEFYVSSKNLQFFENFVLLHLSLNRKKEILVNFLNLY